MTKSEIQKRTLDAKEDILRHLRLAGLWKENHPLRLHLGCGENHFDGYINIDYPPSEHAVQIRVGADLFADISRLDFSEATVDEIRLHHVFEHFSRPKALALLIRWQSWLKIGGRLHLETPDISGCAKALIADRSYKTKQAVLRHAFGSHEAAWAFHLDGWYKEKFEYVLTQLGFLVQCQNVQWEGEPWLANIHAVAVKQRIIPRTTLLAVADEILQDSMVADVPGERMMHKVWSGMLREELRNTRREIKTELFSEGLPADIPVLTDSPEHDALGYDNIEFKENGEYLILTKIVRPGDLIFDVGANKGHWSKLVLGMNPQTRIYAFEPVPETFAVLQKTLSDSKALRFNLALSADDGEKPFYHWNDSSETGELSSFYRRPDVERSMQASVRPIVVLSRTLDTFCQEHKVDQIDFLKIDTEGAELDVLRGAAALLEAKRVRVLQFEYGGTYLDSHITLKQIYELLQQKGYQVYRIIPQGLLYIPCWRAPLENYRYANYLAVAPSGDDFLTETGPKEDEPKKFSHTINVNSLVAVIFSKDRAMQLDGTLRTFFNHCTDAEA
ncbi:MAG: hypothetical protein C0407_09945, partial [Desulfobacca sp.]|nr:hypothetical protein [Desulfobacca sp.]